MVEEAHEEAVPDGAAADVLLVVVVVRRVVVLRDRVGHDELVQRADKRQDPERHQHVEQDPVGPLGAVLEVAGQPVRSGRDVRGGVGQEEAVDQHDKEAALEEGLEDRGQQQGRHLEEHVASDLHAGGRRRDAVLEAARQADHHRGEDPADHGETSRRRRLVLLDALGHCGAAGQLVAERARVDPEVDPQEAEAHDGEQHADPDERLGAVPQEHQVHVRQQDGEEERAEQHRPGRGDGGQRLHDVHVGALQLALGEGVGQVGVADGVRQAVAVEQEDRLVGCHALGARHGRAVRLRVVGRARA
mmetsp:Transcript_50315/g.133045  ORF Transcript_50315/g.133045 Transcript_50315/m.133045 type:complete len:303 (+) Transcript_50315:656-1564(+)